MADFRGEGDILHESKFYYRTTNGGMLGLDNAFAQILPCREGYFLENFDEFQSGHGDPEYLERFYEGGGHLACQNDADTGRAYWGYGFLYRACSQSKKLL